MELLPTAQGTEAWVDLVLLLVGESPRYLLADRDPPGRRRYAQTLASAWGNLAGRLAPTGNRLLTEVFLSYFSQRQWAADSTARRRGQRPSRAAHRGRPAPAAAGRGRRGPHSPEKKARLPGRAPASEHPCQLRAGQLRQEAGKPAGIADVGRGRSWP